MLRGGWLPPWALLYREINLRSNGSRFEMVPKEGSWSVTPLPYSRFDRLEVCVSCSLDTFAFRLIEKAAGYQRLEQAPLDRSILRAFFSEVPDNLHVSGTGFDLDPEAPVFANYVAEHGLWSRLRFVAWDFFMMACQKRMLY